MNREHLYFLNQIFRSRDQLVSLGFMDHEASILYGTLKGESVMELSGQLNRSESEIETIRNLCLGKLPAYIRKKLTMLGYMEMDNIHSKLSSLQDCIVVYMEQYASLKVYTIHELRLARRIKNKLRAMGVTNTKQLMQYSYSDLLAVKSLGAKSVDEILEVMKGLGLHLNDEKNISES